MRRTPTFLPLIAVLVMVTGCSQGSVESADLEPRSEAAAWLQANPNPYALAGNRFASTAEALAFVETLYAVGAMEVLVTGVYDEEWRIELEGGPYADTLIVRLPSEPERRRALFEIVYEEARGEGFSPTRDIG
jgi:hypothetical protein